MALMAIILFEAAAPKHGELLYAPPSCNDIETKQDIIIKNHPGFPLP